MTEKAIIFDFDGTIADTFDAIVSITNCLALEFGYKLATLEDIEQFRNLSSREIIHKSGVSFFKLPFLLRKVRAGLNKKIQELNHFPELKKLL